MFKTTSVNNNATIQHSKQGWPILIGCIAFIFCFLFSVAPLARAGQLTLKGMDLPPHFTPLRTPFLTIWGKWLPADLHLASNHIDSLYRTADLEFLVLIALSVVIYSLLSWWLLGHAQPTHIKRFYIVIWAIAIVVGFILVLTPGMASKDLFVYADYGNMLGIHRKNLYFLTPYQVAPHDTLTIIDKGWSNATSAYGPVWSIVIAGLSLLFGDHALPYFYAYRLLGLACHLITAMLIAKTLRLAGRSERIVVLGTFLFVCNPLALFENALGAHNDIFMSMLILCGFILSVRADIKGFTKFKNYAPALIFFTLATLIKFTSLPIVIFFIMLLVGKTLHTPDGKKQWGLALINAASAFAVFMVLSLVFYAPFWVGHTIGEIARSFATPPSSIKSQNSLMRVAVSWLKDTNGKIPADNIVTRLASILASRNLWNKFDVLVMATSALSVAWFTWRAPTLRTFTLGSIATLGAILLVTPWFYAWYVVWIIAMFPLILAFPPISRMSKALLAFCFVFSITGFATYIDFAFLPIKYFELGSRFFLMIIPPVISALLIYFGSTTQKKTTPEEISTEQPTARIVQTLK